MRFFEKERPIGEKSRLAKSAFLDICERENPSEIDKKLKNLIFDDFRTQTYIEKKMEVVSVDHTE